MGASASTLLAEFKAAWSGGWPATAHLAHFVSGASLGGGVAYVGALCDQTYGFAVSANVNGNISWGSFSGNPSVANWDFVVFAHELGHNLGALHTHDYCPPLDRCEPSCAGSKTCTQGTIMSYCHLCGGMSNVRLDLHPHVAQEVRDLVAGSCLPPPALPAGAALSLTVSFDPTSGSGSRSAQLDLSHTAPNASSPFTLQLDASAP
jgi:hypothetical protein